MTTTTITPCTSFVFAFGTAQRNGNAAAEHEHRPMEKAPAYHRAFAATLRAYGYPHRCDLCSLWAAPQGGKQ